jgi:hypothetical protein
VSLPSGVQWEWAIGEFAVLGFLFWELYSLRKAKRATRERLERERREKAE